MIENTAGTSRKAKRRPAALTGFEQTVSDVSLTVSLIAVLIPLLSWAISAVLFP